jgi:hypothetical protein
VGLGRIPGKDRVAATGGEIIEHLLLEAEVLAGVARFLFFEEFVHDLAFAAGGEHGLERGVDAAFGLAQGCGAFLAAFLECLAVAMDLERLGGGAAGAEPGSDFLPGNIELPLDLLES